MSNITFFIPAYNCSQTIKEAVESIILTNFHSGDELIIVNDGSSDQTGDILNGLKSKYPCITIINHNRNKGGGAARNSAVEASSNELLFCLDSDNVLEPASVQVLKSYLLNNNADVASFQNLNYFSKSISEITEVWKLSAGIFTTRDAFSEAFSPGAGGNYLFTKPSWVRAGGYPEFAGSLDTWGFGIRQLLTGSKFMVMEDTGYYHRLSENSYFLRDAWNRQRSISLRATQILIPFFDQILDEDIDYILSKKHRYSWLENLSKRPLRMTEIPKKNPAFEKNAIKPISSLTQKGHYIINKIKNFIKTDNRAIAAVDVALAGEYTILENIIEAAEEPVVIFDVGANKGDYTRQVLKIAEQLNKNVEVHLFEPQKYNIEILHRSFSHLNNIIINDFGLSNNDETLTIFSDSSGSELASIYEREFFKEQGFSLSKEAARMVPVEDYIKEKSLEKIHLMKIDVEGHELEVVKGIRELLDSRIIKSIQFEYGGTYVDAGTKLRDIYSILGLYYNIGKIKDGTVSYVLYHNDMEDFQYSNYLAVLKEI